MNSYLAINRVLQEQDGSNGTQVENEEETMWTKLEALWIGIIIFVSIAILCTLFAIFVK